MAKKNEYTLLFEQTKAELAKKGSATNLELDITQLQSISAQQHENAAILFDLALEELIDPTAATKYISLAESKAQSSTESGVLSNALENFEKLVQRSFQIPTKTTAARRTTSYRQPITKVATRIVAAPLTTRLRAAILDTTFAALISLALLVIILPLGSLGFFASLDRLVSGSTLEKIPVYGLYLKLLLLAAVLQGILALPKKGITYGLKYFGLKILCVDGSLPTRSQLIVRSLTIPLSLITIPFAFIFSAKSTISDLVSSTMVSRR